MNINLKIVVFLLSVAATVFAIILGVSVGSGEYLWPALVAVFFAVILFISQPALAAAGAITTFSSGITMPGLPGQMRLFDAFAVMLIAIFVLHRAMKAGKPVRFSRLDWIVVLFAGWILLTGFIRGFGFLAFGDSMIGGFYYLRLLLAASLVITLPRIGIPVWSWRVVILLSGLLAPMTVLADLLVSNGGPFEIVRLFVQTSQQATSSMAMDDESGTSVGRLWSAGPAANGMLIALLCLVPIRRFFQPTGFHWLVLFGGIITLSLMSGFRLMTAMLFLIAVLALFFQKGFTAPRLLLLFIAGAVGLCVVYYYSSSLPNNIQRSVSWLPGIDVSSAARGDAEQTIDWRLRLWSEALRYLPDYWLIGKGFSYNARDMIAAFQAIYIDDLKWAIVVGAYHNGWLSMILCTGVFGALLCLTLMIAPMIRHWKKQRAPWNNALLMRYHGVLLAALIANGFVFLVVYGDVHASFPPIFFQWALLEMLVHADPDAPSQASSDAMPEDASDSTYQS